MKIKHVMVNTIDAYFSLPVTEREWYGLYRKPYALEWDFMDDNKGWSVFYLEIRKRYPLQWFFREWLFSCENPVYYAFNNLRHKFWDVKYTLKHIIKPVFPRWRKTLPRHKYVDGTVLIVESNFNIILDFYYNEVIDGCVDWQADESHARFFKELKSNVEWIERGRKEHHDKMDEELSLAHKNKSEKDYKTRYGKYDLLDQQLKNDETVILKWLIDNRDYFWT